MEKTSPTRERVPVQREFLTGFGFGAVAIGMDSEASEDLHWHCIALAAKERPCTLKFRTASLKPDSMDS